MRPRYRSEFNSVPTLRWAGCRLSRGHDLARLADRETARLHIAIPTGESTSVTDRNEVERRLVIRQPQKLANVVVMEGSDGDRS